MFSCVSRAILLPFPLACLAESWEERRGTRTFLLPETDADFPSYRDQFVIRIDESETVDRISNWYIESFRILVAHHCAEFALGDQLNRLDAELHSQLPVNCRWSSASLKMPKNATPGILAGSLDHFRSRDLSNAAKPMLTIDAFR